MDKKMKISVKSGAYGKVELDEVAQTARKRMPLEHNEFPYFIIREMSTLHKCKRLQIPHVVSLRAIEVTSTEAILEFPLFASCLWSFLTKEKSVSERIRVGKLALRNIAMAFAELHRYNILYRDCKPSNMLLNKAKDEVVLADLGGVREITWGMGRPRKREIWGLSADVCTFLYAAPESVTQTYNYLTDIYSLGVSCFQIITGEIFENKHLDLDKAKIIWQDFKSKYNTKLDNDTYHLIWDMMQTDIVKRPTALQVVSRSGATMPIPAALATPKPLGLYWKGSAAQNLRRRELVEWICDTCMYLEMQYDIIYVVHLLDEFLAIYLTTTPLTNLQITCIAVTCLFMITKFSSAQAPHAEEFLRVLELRSTFLPADLQRWERTIVKVLRGNLIPRSISRVLLTCNVDELKGVLREDSYLLGPLHLPELILKAKQK